MKIDIASQIGAVTREVSSRQHNGSPARAVVAACTYNTTVKDLWDAITNSERIRRWFLPISGDLRLGGHYQLEGNAHGEITRCEPPRHLSLTWEYGDDVSWVNFRIERNPEGGTRLELEHVNHVTDQLWEQFGPGAVGVGWDLALLGLNEHLSTGAAVDLQEAEVWPTSSEGKEFVRRCSQDWCRASIAAGTEEVLAKGAAGRTTAFYTGESEAPARN